MIQEKYKSWNVLYNGDKRLLDYIDNIINYKDIDLIKEVKNNKRSLVLIVQYIDQALILKSPKEKNTRKWIRFTTLFRKGESFKSILNMEKLNNIGIKTNIPLMAIEKRVLGMVVDSWILYKYEEGDRCDESNYFKVVEKLKEIHTKNILHGDPQIRNFLYNGKEIITIDCNPRKVLLGNVSKVYEYLYLEKSAKGIDKYFDLSKGRLSYKIAKKYSDLYWAWRRFKKKIRRKETNLLKILIIRLSSIGDVILTTPVLEAIKAKFPEVTLDFLVMDKFKDAISGNKHIDNLIVFEKEKYKGITGILAFSKKLKENRYDLVIDLHSKIRPILISKMLGNKVLRYKKRSWWKTLFVNLRIMKYHVDDTIVRNYFRPLNVLGITYTKEKLAFNFKKENGESVEEFKDAVVMAPGAANNTKKWPKEYFAALGQPIEEKIVLIGGKEDFNESELIKKEIGDRCVNLAGKLNLKESGALISKSKYVITNDTGPFHIARGVCTKVFVIFGPTDPGMFEYDKDAILLFEGVKCSPCSLHGDKKCPKKHFKCMRELTPEKVYKVIKENIN